MYDTIEEESISLHMGNDFSLTRINCETCPPRRICEKKKRPLQPFPTFTPRKHISMDTPAELVHTWKQRCIRHSNDRTMTVDEKERSLHQGSLRRGL